jgi:hypothetical protein
MRGTVHDFKYAIEVFQSNEKGKEPDFKYLIMLIFFL